MIGFDIGGTKCAVSVGESCGGGINIKSKRSIPTDRAKTPYEIIDELCRLAEEMTDDFSRIGISCGGPLDSERGVILSPPNLPGWDNVEIVRYLTERYHGKAALQNDANACALAEWKYGAGRGCDNMAFLTFGTGLGAGLILGGRLYGGASGMAGEIGHIRLAPSGPMGYGKSGSFEGFCSGGGIAALGAIKATEAYKRGGGVSYCDGKEHLDSITAKRIAECAKEGFSDALDVFRISGERLGEGLSVLIDIINPEVIVIGSIFTRCEELLREHMERVLKRECLPHSLRACRILPSALGEKIGDYAALAVADSIL